MCSIKKILYPNFILLFVFFNSQAIMAQKVATYQCKWHVEAVPENSEALIDHMQLHEKSQFLYFISNDEKNLYIDLITADNANIQKIMRYGLTTWINPDGKQKKSMGVQFPLPPASNGQSSFRRDKGGDRKDMMMAAMALRNQEMILIGFDEKGEKVSIDPRINADFGASVSMQEGGQINVSLVIPLDKLNRDISDPVIPPISLGFETGYMDVTGQGMSSGGSMSGRGDMHGGGMPGGGPPPGMSPDGRQGSTEQSQQPDINELASPSKMWIKQVRLAKGH